MQRSLHDLIPIAIKQFFCLHRVQEEIENNPKENYIESVCVRCDKIIFKNTK